MNNPTVGRLRNVALALSVTGAVALAPAPSQAAVLGTTMVVATVNFDDDPDMGVTCTQTGPGDVPASPITFAADGVPVTRSATSSAVITDNANLADKTTMSASGTTTVTAKQANGQLSTVHLATTTSTSLTTAIANTKCGASVEVGGGTQFQFDLVAPALVTVRAEAHHMAGIVELGNLMGPSESEAQAVVVYALGSHGTSSGSILLPAGTSFVGLNELVKEARATAAATTTSSSGDLTVDITFEKPGGATTSQSGGGGKYVSLGSDRDCAAGTLPLTWKKKAGKGTHRVVSKAIVKVNGAKVATIRKPHKKQVTTLTGLEAEDDAAVEVTLTVQGKGRLTTERSYLRCG